MASDGYNTIVLDHRNNFKTGGLGDDHILGKQGNDTVNGQRGNDILEGNRGDDKVNGEGGDDLIFGGVGNDTVSGGSGADVFSMRILRGGDNVIKDFELGEDSLQLVFNRRHFVLENDIVEAKLSSKFDGDVLESKVEAREGKIEAKLDSQVSRITDKLDKKIGFDSEKVTDANSFVEESIQNHMTITSNGSDLVLTFLGDTNLGTSITLNGLAADPSIQNLLTLLDGQPDNAAIIARLTDPSCTYGTSIADELQGTSEDDCIDALAGDDVIFGAGGNDKINGGEGIDTVGFSGSVLDYNFQTYGFIKVTDTVNERDGVDHLSNFEKLAFDEGTFTWMRGHNAGDNLTAHDGVDTIMVGMHGHDTLNGGTGNDVLLGDNGTNFHYQGGNDVLNGGAGNDILVGGAGNDTLNGGEGEDTAAFSGSVTEYHFMNRLTVVDKVSDRDGTDQLKEIENAAFSDGTYALKIGHNAYDNLVAQDGVDTLLVGADGDDKLTGGTGNDVLIGDNSIEDTYNAGNDTLDGGAGSDIILAGGGDDYIRADEYAPAHLAIHAESDVINGGDGVDTLWYNDTFKNADSLNVKVVDEDTFSVDTMLAGSVTSTDTVTSVEVLYGTRGDDVIDFSGLGHGMTYNDKSSGAGQDEVTGSDYNDIIKVMHGDDTVYASNGQDYVDGGHGQDKLVFDAATAHIHVEANGPAYKQEYKVYDSSLVVNNDTDIDNDIFTIVKNVEQVHGNDGYIDIL
jgi:Ca2+-binding RTX toxin-like protein